MIKIRVFYPTRNKERNYDRDWDIRVGYKYEKPTQADIERDYKELPIQGHWQKVFGDVNPIREEDKEAFLDAIFTDMNNDNLNPMSTDIMQNWIRQNKVSHTSMSVGDVIALDDVFYVCATEGWEEV